MKRVRSSILSLMPGIALLLGCSRGIPYDTLDPLELPYDVEIRVPRNMPGQTRSILLNAVENTLKDEMQRLLLSVKTSEISAINQVGNTVRLPVSRETYNLLLLTQDFNRRTGGAYDITTSPIACLWGFYGSPVPEREIPDELLTTTLKSIGPTNLRLAQNTAELRTSYIRLNLDDIARAYAIDLAIIKIRRLNYGDLLLSFADNARALGHPSGKLEWTYPLPNPFDSKTPLAQIRLARQPAVSIAQIGEDFVTINGKRYGRIIDPATGRPAEGLALVAVLAPTATRAHALAQALFVLGPEKGMKIMPEFAECEALFIPDEKPHHALATRGMLEALDWPQIPAMPCTLLE
ncbi:MAG: FAD:protein FMN transferase [Kiritimatiellae bacterium]|nr:FAD:protein FMN transferase [Kiritimatiellia bacterium]